MIVNKFRPILISLSPNTSARDVFLAIRLIFRPDRWFKGEAVFDLEAAFKKYFRSDYAVSFNSGRSALFAILKSIKVGEGDEVLLQAYTCVAVPNSVLWCGARPVFVDIKKGTFNMAPEDLKRKITPKSRAIIVQHTFGQPAEMDEILKIAKDYNLFVIEDCAHALGASYKGSKVGTLSDAAFFSFGRDKVISSVFGGLAITNDNKLGRNLQGLQKSLKYPSRYFTFQQLLHPIAMSVIVPLYNVFNIGKVVLVTLQKLRLLSFPVYENERYGGQPAIFPSLLPNALAVLALYQFERLEKFTEKRKEVANFYSNNLKNEDIKLPKRYDEMEAALLRYTVRTKNAREIRDFAKGKGILLGNWYTVVSPEGVDYEKIGYKKGSCPIAEVVAKESLNLPTHPRMTLEDARKVVEVLQNYLEFKPK